jgi:hypothetical protein
MSKKSSNKRKETNKSHINQFSDTAVDPNEMWTKQFQQAFTTYSSSRTFERTVSKSNIKKKDEHYAAMMLIQGII